MSKRGAAGAFFAFGSHLAAALLPAGGARAQTTITIATVNNGDMVVMQRLAPQFERQNTNIRLRWVVLEENVLRQRLTTDIATRSGQYDILTIGNYGVPIWARQGWLEPFENLPASYGVEDILAPVRTGISHDNKLYALPFYAESAMTYYRTDLLQRAGITMPANPTYAQIREIAEKITDQGN
jgi:sorbitol/mannitol transport system substrate-binding protein